MSVSGYHKKIKESVIEAVEETFENMLFMDAVYMDINEFESDIAINNPIEVNIFINHPSTGEIVLAMNDDLVYHIIKTLFMTPDDKIYYEDKLDITNEILNTISGKIMKKLIPENLTFKLGLPERKNYTIIDDELEPSIFYFNIDDKYFIKLELIFLNNSILIH